MKDLLYSKEDRDSLRHTNVFNETNKIWNDYAHNKRTNIGTISFLLRSAHNIFSGNNKTLMTFKEWEAYYLMSGKKRQLELASCKDEKEKEKIDLYHGRTVEDIIKIAENFKKSLDANGYTLSFTKVYNFCYIRIVDEAYIGYKREYNTISSLQKLYPDYKFEFANDYDDVQLGVDIVVKKDDKTIGGFQVKSVIYRDSDKSYNLDAKRVNHKKFQKCLKEYGFEPQYIYVDKKGNISEPYPKIEDIF